MSQVFRDMLKLAEIKKTSQLLAEEIEKTCRRVNALEYVKIPQMEESIKYITLKAREGIAFPGFFWAKEKRPRRAAFQGKEWR